MDGAAGAGRSWWPMGSQSTVNLNGPHSSSAPLIDPSSSGAGGDDGLGISVPQASFVPREYGTSYVSPVDTPRPDRPLLYSPVAQQHAASPPPPLHAPFGGAFGRPAAQGGAKPTRSFSGPALSSSKEENPFSSNLPRAHLGHHEADMGNPMPEEQEQYRGPGDANAVRMTPLNLGDQPRSATMDAPQYDDISGTGFVREYTKIAHDCQARTDFVKQRWSWFSCTILFLSVYCTVMSTLWLAVAIARPTWIFVGSGIGQVQHSSATLLTTLFAKTIEMSFVTVFVTFLGQTLSRRAFSKLENGVTLAELTMRNWMVQPGSLMTHKETIRYSGATLLGALTLLATVAATFYTTASDAMVSPKLMYGKWHERSLSGAVQAVFSHQDFMKDQCQTPVRKTDTAEAGGNCLNIHYAGHSYHNLLDFMAEWQSINARGAQTKDWSIRPNGTANLFPNTTLVSAWIDREHSNITKKWEEHGRIINNVTLAMPHAGVYLATMDPFNSIPQPQDLDGIGEYEVRASVVSPAVGVLCVEMTPQELEPMVYPKWTGAQTNDTNILGQKIGTLGWDEKLPKWNPWNKTDNDYFNKTVVDDIFRWGFSYKRRHPVFRMYPIDYNMVTATREGDSMYILGKPKPNYDKYALCELRSWLSTKCSTRMAISGTKGGRLTAHCEDPNDEDSFEIHHTGPFDINAYPYAPRDDWRVVVDQLRLSLNLNGGESNNNASNARFFNLLAVTQPTMPATLPTMAEGLAVLVGSTLVTGTIKTPFDGNWHIEDHTQLDEPYMDQFQSTVRMMGYMSNHAEPWQGIFYAVLVTVVAINLLCLVAFTAQWQGYFLTDYTEPANMFGLAMMSPPSAQLRGCCGAGPKDRDLVVPWRVSGFPDYDYSEGDELCANNDAVAHTTGYSSAATTEAGTRGHKVHFFFQEAMPTPWRGRWKGTQYGESPDMATPRMVDSYQRLSNRKSFM